MKYYTGKGDKGETSTMKGRVRKDDPIVEVIGELDELNSIIGVAIAFQKDKKVIKILKRIQDNLFTIGAQILSDNSPKISEKHIRELENYADSFNIGELKKFILPGGSQTSSLLHYARAFTRSVERIMVKAGIDGNPLAYINRLSSLLYVMSVYVAKKDRIKFENPTYT